MPYNPGVQDVSGQLRAQGIRGASSTITQGFEEFGKRERERQSALGSIMGSIQGDPSFMEEVSKNPDSDLAKIFSRAQSGRASNAEIQQLSGLAASHRFDQERQVKATAAAEDRKRNDALNTLSIAQAAQNKGAADAMAKATEQATKEAEAIAKFFTNPDRPVGENGERIPWGADEFIKHVGSSGVPMSGASTKIYEALFNREQGNSKTAQRATEAEEKARIAQAKVDQSKDREMEQIDNMVERGDYTEEEGKQQRRKLMDYRTTRPLGAGAEFAAALDELDKKKPTPAGAGAGAGKIDPRVQNIIPGGKTPAPRGGRMITVQNPSTGATFQVDESRAQEFLALGAKIL